MDHPVFTPKKPNTFLVVAMLSVLVTGPMSTFAQDDDGVAMLRRIGKTFAAIAEKASPAVVVLKIDTRPPQERSEAGRPRRREPQGNWQPVRRERLSDQGIIDTAVVRRLQRLGTRQQSLGLGFIVSEDGYILTSHHVIARASKVRAELADGRKFDAKIIGADPATDVAVVKIDADDLPALELGDSDALSVGDWVVGIGNSMGLGRTMSVGLVTAKGRSGLGIAAIEDLIQTDLKMHLGDAGGPLLDLDGKVVGINTAVPGRDRGPEITLAIPVDMASFAYGQILETGTVERGFLGVAFGNITAETAESLGIKTTAGVMVSNVIPDSAASKAGIERYDVIAEIDGVPIKSGSQLLHLVASLKPGEEVKVVVLRDGERQTLTVTLGKRPSERGTTPDKD
ncbi:MAG: PDZ domain-containing protein [Woeseiaceae bacterium]|nr:PDZ domain-containing protein [Woeseiaceae bacterium]